MNLAKIDLISVAVLKGMIRFANVVIYRLSGGVKWGLLAKPEKS